MLLASDEPSQGLMAFLSKKAFFITKLLFEIFEDNSAGSFYHAFRVLDILIQYHANDVYAALMADDCLGDRIDKMLR